MSNEPHLAPHPGLYICLIVIGQTTLGFFMQACLLRRTPVCQVCNNGGSIGAGAPLPAVQVCVE